MDYKFITPNNYNGISNNRGWVNFNFTPTSACNFFESSLVIKLNYKTVKKATVNEIEASTPVQKFKKFFIYDIFDEVNLMISKQKYAKQTNIFDYIRCTQMHGNDPRDRLYGLKEIPCNKHYDAGELVFNIPLRLLFPQFKTKNYIDSEEKELSLSLKNIDHALFDSLNESLDFQYKIERLVLKVPYYLSFEEVSKDMSKEKYNTFNNVTNISHLINSSKVDIDCISTTDRPLSFVAFFKDSNNSIVDGVESIRLMINNDTIPTIDSDEETGLEHYYELYLRHLDYTYGNVSLEKYEKVTNILSFEEYCKSPVFYFILPNIKEAGHYSMKLKIKFKKHSKCNEIFYMFNYLSF